MPDAVSNTSPLLYLYRIQVIDWLPILFDTVSVPSAVVTELSTGRQGGYDVPDPSIYSWLHIVDTPPALPEWISLELGAGELSAMALALQHSSIVLLDDQLARHTAQASGIEVWGTLRVILEAKLRGHVAVIAPYITQLESAGMWLSQDIRQRILKLANE